MQTDKPVNISQLAHELGGIAARWSGPDEDGVIVCLSDDVTEQQWDSAVAAHVADDEWTDPDAAPPAPTREEIIASLPNPATDFAGFKTKLAEILST